MQIQKLTNSFYSNSIRCWNKIGPELRNSLNPKSCKATILALIRPQPMSIFDIHDPVGIKCLFQLRVILVRFFLLNVSFAFAQKTSNTITSTAHVIHVPGVPYLITCGQ